MVGQTPFAVYISDTLVTLKGQGHQTWEESVDISIQSVEKKKKQQQQLSFY